VKHILISLAFLCVLFGLVWLAALLFFTHTTSTPPEWTSRAARMLPAAREYARRLKAEGAQVPPFVEVKQLVDRGLLDQDDLRAFAGTEITVSTSQSTNRSDNVLIRARQPNGTEMVLLVDGSVHTR
jgi:hypothetical protein